MQYAVLFSSINYANEPKGYITIGYQRYCRYT